VSAFVADLPVVCIAIALTMPPLEILPFVASLSGAALTAFGLSLVAGDGLLGLIAWVFTLATAGVVATVLLGG
jgi:hypothetical protein